MRKKASRVLSVVILVFVQLALPSGCGKQAKPTPWSDFIQSPIVNLPEPVMQAHQRSYVFVVDEFWNPYTSRMVGTGLTVDGNVERYRVSLQDGLGAVIGSLTQQDREEVRSILEAMTQIAPTDLLSGPKIVALSFFWHGEYYLLLFDESSCPEELARLFEIISTATDHFWNPFYEESDSTPSPMEDLPPLVESQLGGHYPFLAVWYNKPFSDVYDRLYFFPNRYGFASNDIEYRAAGSSVGAGAAFTDSEVQEIWTLLESLANAGEVKQQPVGDTIITFGFSWEANYHLLVVGDMNCPDELDRLFMIIEASFERIDIDSFQNPCQEQ